MMKIAITNVHPVCSSSKVNLGHQNVLSMCDSLRASLRADALREPPAK